MGIGHSTANHSIATTNSTNLKNETKNNLIENNINNNDNLVNNISRSEFQIQIKF